MPFFKLTQVRQVTRNVRYLSGSPLNRPAPPPLPPKEQREFEELVRAAATPAASTNATVTSEAAALEARIEKGGELHPDARRPLEPEFEGDTNPVTGEVGGPKREPLRHGDWSYGGRTRGATMVPTGDERRRMVQGFLYSVVPELGHPAADNVVLVQIVAA